MKHHHEIVYKTTFIVEISIVLQKMKGHTFIFKENFISPNHIEEGAYFALTAQKNKSACVMTIITLL